MVATGKIKNYIGILKTAVFKERILISEKLMRQATWLMSIPDLKERTEKNLPNLPSNLKASKTPKASLDNLNLITENNYV